MNLGWRSALLLLQVCTFTYTQDVITEFITAVPRLNSSTNMDYYFCCSVTGTFLQWQYNQQPLSGFWPNEIGRVLLDERSDYTYTVTLLSSQPVDNNQYKMDSVLVMSFLNGTDPGQFKVACISGLNINSVTAGSVGQIKKYDENEEIRLEHVASGNVVSNRNRTHIFMCGVRNTPQLINVTGSTLVFSKFDDIGRARAIVLDDRNTVDVQGILIERGSYQAITLIFVATSSDIVNIVCSDNVSSLSFLSLEEQFELALEATTFAILDTTINPKESTANEVTEKSTLVTDLNFGTSTNVYWIVPITLVSPLVAAVLFAIIVAWFRSRQKNTEVDLTKYQKDSGMPTEGLSTDILHYFELPSECQDDAQKSCISTEGLSDGGVNEVNSIRLSEKQENFSSKQEEVSIEVEEELELQSGDKHSTEQCFGHSPKFKPIVDSDNAFALYFEDQLDEAENNTMIMLKETAEGNSSSNYCEKLEDDSSVSDGRNTCMYNNERSMRGKEEAEHEDNGKEWGNCGSRNNNDSIGYKRHEEVNEKEFHQLTSSASTAETDTCPIENTKMYCFISVGGLPKEDKMPTTDAFELSSKDCDETFEIDHRESKLLKELFAFTWDNEPQDNGRNLDDSMVMGERPILSLPHGGSDAARPADMVVRQRLNKSVNSI